LSLYYASFGVKIVVHPEKLFKYVFIAHQLTRASAYWRAILI